MENFENYSQADLFELSLISDAKTWLEYAKIDETEPNPWDDEGYFDIPAYLREKAEKDFYGYIPEKGDLPF